MATSEAPPKVPTPPVASEEKQAPYPGSKKMPRWDLGELVDAPRFTWKNWVLLLGPGLLTGGSAIGGGEWLMGPIVTAKYGGALLWLATISIVAQVVYNIEISRYTLYTGEPIFTGKFRILPGPGFWLCVYLLLDFGAVFPYLAANAATPAAALLLGKVPVPDEVGTLTLMGSEITFYHKTLLKILAFSIFYAALIPLIFGGKIYNALRAVMTFKIVVVMGFLLILGFFHSDASTWKEIFSGFVKFGNVPIQVVEDHNGNGVLDPGEDWDGDGRLDVIEPSLKKTFHEDLDGKPDATDIDRNDVADPMVTVEKNGKQVRWPDLNRDGIADVTVMVDVTGDGVPEGPFPLDANQDGKLDLFIDVDGDGIRDGDNLDNLFSAAKEGRPFPTIDWTLIGFLCALVAISGNGGLSNTPISNYTRDQGWGMGHLVGAIPSVVGGQNIKLSHVGCVFQVNEQSLPRWKRWYKHICRDQLVVWMPACFFGLALPSMLSVQFLPRGTEVENNWVAAGMTADAVQNTLGGWWGSTCWYLTLFCGFMVLAPSMASSADGVVRRWVDVFWTASPMLRRLDPGSIRYVYFTILVVFTLFGTVMLSFSEPTTLMLVGTIIFNYALGFSCWHTLCLNLVLLPRELRPNWLIRIMLALSGVFFFTVAILATISAVQKFGPALFGSP